MAFETFKARISLLLNEMAQRPEDAHVLQERLREKLEEMKALGLPLPDDLVELEAWLERDLEGDRRRPAPGAADPPRDG